MPNWFFLLFVWPTTGLPSPTSTICTAAENKKIFTTTWNSNRLCCPQPRFHHKLHWLLNPRPDFDHQHPHILIHNKYQIQNGELEIPIGFYVQTKTWSTDIHIRYGVKNIKAPNEILNAHHFVFFLFTTGFPFSTLTISHTVNNLNSRCHIQIFSNLFYSHRELHCRNPWLCKTKNIKLFRHICNIHHHIKHNQISNANIHTMCNGKDYQIRNTKIKIVIHKRISITNTPIFITAKYVTFVSPTRNYNQFSVRNRISINNMHI